MSPALAAIPFIGSSGLIPLAGVGLSIPFLGQQQQGEDNIYGGINFGASPTISNPFQGLLNMFSKKDKFTENFLKEGINDTSGTILKTDTFTPSSGTESLVENKPTTMLQEQNQILGADGQPISGSTTFDNTDISSTTSSNNNNNNNNKKDKNNLFKTMGNYALAGGAFSLGSFLTDKIRDAFSKKDDKDEDDGKSDFEDMTGMTYKDAMEMQRKRENELMNKRALMGGIKDASQYAYLGGQAQMEAAKNIGLNTQDMLRSMAYGQAALANTIAGASKTVPLARTYFS